MNEHKINNNRFKSDDNAVRSMIIVGAVWLLMTRNSLNIHGHSLYDIYVAILFSKLIKIAYCILKPQLNILNTREQLMEY